MDRVTQRRAARRLLLSSISGRRRDVFVWAIWSAIEALPAVLGGHVVAWAIDRGFLVGRTQIGLEYLGLFAASVLVGAVGTRQAFQRLAALVEPFRDQLVSLAVRGALRRSVTASAKTETAAVARLTQQVEIVREAYASTLMAVQGFVVTAVGALIGLGTLLPAALVFVLGPLLVGVILFLAVLGRMAVAQRRSIIADERLSEATSGVCSGIRDVVACGGEAMSTATIGESIAEQEAATIRVARFRALRALAIALGAWLPVVLILLRAPALTRDGASIGAIVGSITYVLQGILPALQSFVRNIGSSGLWLLVTLGRIVEASEVTEPIARPVDYVPEADAAVEVGQVTFAYGPEADPVIDGLELTVPPGDHLAIVGPSGAGKSTLANLISGILMPQRGQVRYGSHPALCLDPGVLARHRVLIPQETYLFKGTVRENLLYLNEQATDVELDRAVEQVGAQALVERIGGYAAVLQASELSAGEQQLLTLVRAHLSPARLAILDEATCHLDAVAEARAEEAFARRDGTLIVIAHRISSALRARRILVLDGTEVMLGTHEELLERSELYRNLVGHWQGDDGGEEETGALLPALREDEPPAASLSGRRARAVAAVLSLASAVRAGGLAARAGGVAARAGGVAVAGGAEILRRRRRQPAPPDRRLEAGSSTPPSPSFASTSVAQGNGNGSGDHSGVELEPALPES